MSASYNTYLQWIDKQHDAMVRLLLDWSGINSGPGLPLSGRDHGPCGHGLGHVRDTTIQGDKQESFTNHKLFLIIMECDGVWLSYSLYFSLSWVLARVCSPNRLSTSSTANSAV